MPEEERYEYMLEGIEESLFGSTYSCELDKAWDGIQYCLGDGQWSEEILDFYEKALKENCQVIFTVDLQTNAENTYVRRNLL